MRIGGSSLRGGLLLVVLAGVIWGSIGTAVQLAHERSGLSPLAISGWRGLAAVAVLLIAVLLAGRLPACRAVLRRHPLRALVTGVLTAVFQLLFAVAVVAAGVGVSTVVCLGFAPVLLLVLAGVRRRRVPPTGDLLTIVVALLGLALVSLTGATPAEADHPVLGLLAALASGAAYALSTELGATLTGELDTLAVTAVTMTAAALVLVVGGLGVAWLRGDVVGTRDAGSWLLVAYLGVVTMAIAYGLLYAALRTVPSGSAVVATLIEPVTAVLLAAVLLGERVTVPGVLGSLLILTAIGSLGRSEPPPQPQ